MSGDRVCNLPDAQESIANVVDCIDRWKRERERERNLIAFPAEGQMAGAADPASI